MRSVPRTLSLVAALLALSACSKEESAEVRPASTSSTSSPSSPTASPHLLKIDLVDAVPVLDAVKKDSGTEVAVVGRVSGVAKGTITIVDDSLDYCGRGADGMDDCSTPWDYCCIAQDTVSAATIVVKAQTPDGKPVPKDEIGLRPLDLVALRGKLEKNDKGGASLVATSGWFRRERPVVGAHVKFTD